MPSVPLWFHSRAGKMPAVRARGMSLRFHIPGPSGIFPLVSRLSRVTLNHRHERTRSPRNYVNALCPLCLCASVPLWFHSRAGKMPAVRARGMSSIRSVCRSYPPFRVFEDVAAPIPSAFTQTLVSSAHTPLSIKSLHATEGFLTMYFLTPRCACLSIVIARSMPTFGTKATFGTKPQHDVH